MTKHLEKQANYLFIKLALIFFSIFFMAIAILAATPTYVKNTDKAEFEKYKAYCSVLVKTNQVGKIKLVKITNKGENYGKYMGVHGEYQQNAAKDTVWFSVYPNWSATTADITTPDSLGMKYSFQFEPNEMMVTRRVTIPRRKATIADFYNWWIPTHAKTGN